MDLSTTDVVILCGGLGTRLRTVVGDQQKTMAQVDGQPFLDILLQYLSQQGVRRVILCTGYQSQTIADYYGKGKFGLEISLSPENEPLGTGGALKNAQPHIHSDPFMVLNGDCFCELNYVDFLASHLKRKAQLSLVLIKVQEAKDYGSIASDKSGRILNFQEKISANASGHISAGVYCFSREALGWMPKEKKFMLEKDFFPVNLDKAVFAFSAQGKFIDIGTPERFKEAQQLLSRQQPRDSRKAG